LLSVIDIMDWE